MLFHQLVDRRHRDAPPVLQGDEQGVLVDEGQGVPICHPVLNGFDAGVVQEQDALFIALAQHPQLVVSNIRYIQVHQLRDPQAAV